MEEIPRWPVPSPTWPGNSASPQSTSRKPLSISSWTARRASEEPAADRLDRRKSVISATSRCPVHLGPVEQPAGKRVFQEAPKAPPRRLPAQRGHAPALISSAGLGCLFRFATRYTCHCSPPPENALRRPSRAKPRHRTGEPRIARRTALQLRAFFLRDPTPFANSSSESQVAANAGLSWSTLPEGPGAPGLERF